MERGSDKHGPRKDEALEKDLRGMIGRAGGHREEWRDPEADDGPSAVDEDAADGDAAAEAERQGRELSVANGTDTGVRRHGTEEPR